MQPRAIDFQSKCKWYLLWNFLPLCSIMSVNSKSTMSKSTQFELMEAHCGKQSSRCTRKISKNPKGEAKFWKLEWTWVSTRSKSRKLSKPIWYFTKSMLLFGLLVWWGPKEIWDCTSAQAKVLPWMICSAKHKATESQDGVLSPHTEGNVSITYVQLEALGAFFPTPYSCWSKEGAVENPLD